ncbi:MAG: protein-tyrosine kinase [Lachnospiraceae bacterium]|nr:protein-tyrosine kinase [Lachnospiraceae bacterium]
METSNQIQSEEIEIDLVELIGVIVSKLWIIVICAALAGTIAFLLSEYVMTPQYISTTKMYIINRQSNEQLTYSDLQTGTQLTKDYQELVTSRPVLDEVREELALAMDNKELKSKITVSVPTDTRIVTITVQDSSPDLARAIADEIRNSASKHISAVMNTEAVNVVEEADLPLEPSSPKIVKNTVIGGAIGAFISMAFIILVYIMDDSVKNPDDVEHYLKVSVLGSIPYEEENEEEDTPATEKKKKKSSKHKRSSYGRRSQTPVNMDVLTSGKEMNRSGY